ncbi:N-acetylglucosamine-6-phosphate deacetylase [Polycladidibacter stylochi]|uniref:N-acetylglucosamine-6-phosphate deacetylase n=1 Tax=Polycladidibacter stylochi TaxID=1807766 RepID=UPI00083240F1|nr:N-acetylglucosamine-6-phosphate deacetylase [Pseudovibrio stylochi]
MTHNRAYTGADIFTGSQTLKDHALLVQDDKIIATVPAGEVPEDYEKVQLDGDLLAPGFIDLQVNGGGGVQLNDQPTLEGLQTICKSLIPFGTTAILPTLITDNKQVNAQLRDAARAAIAAKTPGFLGLHLEGPHLSVEKRGCHSADLVRPMDTEDLEALVALKKDLPVLLVTLAPENEPDANITALRDAGVFVCLGHTNAKFERAQAALAAGATGFTHLFNAMSPMSHREPGVVGAALSSKEAWAGLICDGYHAHPEMMKIALRAKQGPGKIFLVTDAMAPMGTELQSFVLNGETITRSGGRLTTPDGTLAGADLDFISAVRNAITMLGVDKEEALRMAALYPAQAAGVADKMGQFTPGTQANMVLLSRDLDVNAVWIDGKQQY